MVEPPGDYDPIIGIYGQAYRRQQTAGMGVRG